MERARPRARFWAFMVVEDARYLGWVRTIRVFVLE